MPNGPCALRGEVGGERGQAATLILFTPHWRLKILSAAHAFSACWYREFPGIKHGARISKTTSLCSCFSNLEDRSERALLFARVCSLPPILMAEDRAQKALVKRLNLCLKRPENLVCADCPMRLPRWASVNLGIFVCTNCSGIHRSLGVHISFVRSTQLDRWSEVQVVKLERMGNHRANLFWEANLPRAAKPMSSDLPVVEKFIRKKYERKEFADRNAPGPVPGDGNGDGASSVAQTLAPAQFVVPAAVAHTAPAATANEGLFDMLNVAAPSAGAVFDAFGAAPAGDGFGDFASAAVAPTNGNGGFANFAEAPPVQAASVNGNFASFGAAPAPAAPAAAPAVDEGWGAFSDAAPAQPAPLAEISKNDILSMFDTPGSQSMMGGAHQMSAPTQPQYGQTAPAQYGQFGNGSGMGGGMMGGNGIMPTMQQGMGMGTMGMGGQVPAPQIFGAQQGMCMPGMQPHMMQNMAMGGVYPGMAPQQQFGMSPQQPFGMGGQMPMGGNPGMYMGGNPGAGPTMGAGALDDGFFSQGGAVVRKEPEKVKTAHHPAFDQFGL